MGMLVVLVERSDVTISTTTSQRLAGLGVQSVQLLRGGQTTAIVLEGWAFDPLAGGDIGATLAPGDQARALLPVMRVEVGDGGS